MNRSEIEIKLNRDRAWLLETFAGLSEDQLLQSVTLSEHDRTTYWTPKDHLAHLAGIERNLIAMVRQHLDGNANPVGLMTNPDGSSRSREEIMKHVHSITEAWVLEHRDKPLDEVVALGQEVRAETIALLATLTDVQLAEKVPGAPWGDGTVGTVIALHADHGRMHWSWVKAGFAARGGASLAHVCDS